MNTIDNFTLIITFAAHHKNYRYLKRIKYELFNQTGKI